MQLCKKYILAKWKEAISWLECLFKSRKYIEHEKNTQTQIYRNGWITSILFILLSKLDKNPYCSKYLGSVLEISDNVSVI